MSDSHQKEANAWALMITKYIAIILGNFCAISVVYFALRNDFLMPQTMQVMGLWFVFCLVAIFMVHLLLKPLLAKRYLLKLTAGGN